MNLCCNHIRTVLVLRTRSPHWKCLCPTIINSWFKDLHALNKLMVLVSETKWTIIEYFNTHNFCPALAVSMASLPAYTRTLNLYILDRFHVLKYSRYLNKLLLLVSETKWTIIDYFNTKPLNSRVGTCFGLRTTSIKAALSAWAGRQADRREAHTRYLSGWHVAGSHYNGLFSEMYMANSVTHTHYPPLPIVKCTAIYMAN